MAVILGLKVRLFCYAAAIVAPGLAYSQTSTLLLPAVPIDKSFDRGHNVSVAERSHPEYDPVGIRLGSFIVNPQLTTSVAYSSNVYNDNSNKRSDIYTGLAPYISIASDWSVHELRLTAAGDIRRFANETLRDQNAWNAAVAGRADVTRELNVTFSGVADRSYESPFSGDVIANLTIPSTYFRTAADVRGVFEGTKARITGTLNRSSYDFNSIGFADGTVRSQQYRDKIVYLESAVFEFGYSPSLSTYLQIEADQNNYSSLSFGNANRDSAGYRAALGSNFDIAGLARGTVAIGYSYRSFEATQFYRNASGLSAEAHVEYFLSDLTTIGLLLRRRLNDSDIGNAGTSWNNSIRANIDHELLYNLIVSVNVEASKRTYTSIATASNVFLAEIRGRYQVTRGLGFDAEIGYGSSDQKGSGLGSSFNEARARLSVRLRR